MSQQYDELFKKKIVRLHLEEGRTIMSIAKEYGIGKSTISKWCAHFNKECQTDPQAQEDYDYMKENLRLRKELEEAKKENLFLKKAAAFVCHDQPISFGYAVQVMRVGPSKSPYRWRFQITLRCCCQKQWC